MAELHIPGPMLRSGTIHRQRCAWCGEVLFQLDERETFCSGAPEAWPVGSLLEIDSVGSRVVEHVGGAYPKGCCAYHRPPAKLAIVDAKRGEVG